MDNRPCIDCPDQECCDKDKCYKYQGYLAKEASKRAPKSRLIPRACAQHDCFYNDGFACFQFDYAGPTMAEFCPHYSRD